MLKFNKGFIRSVVTALSLLLLVFFVSAEDIEKDISAIFSNMKIILNGKETDLKDVNGNRIEPFTVNGTIYVPMELISSSRRMAQYDERTNSIRITDTISVSESYQFDFENKILNIIKTETDKPTKVSNIPMHISDEGRIYLLKPCAVYDRTTDEIWNKMGINVFGYISGGFIYKNREQIHLPGRYIFGSLGQVCVADLNNDGDYQLLYFSTWGSGVNGHSLNCYSEKYKITCDMSWSFGAVLSKTDDRNVYVNGLKLRLEKSEDGYVLIADKPVDE